MLCNVVNLILASTHGACATLRVSVIPGGLLLLIGKEVLKILERGLT